MEDVKLVSCISFLNHHEKYMCNEIYALLGANYLRVSLGNLSDEQGKLGYADTENVPYNNKISSDEITDFYELCDRYDVIDYGAAPEEF